VRMIVADQRALEKQHTLRKHGSWLRADVNDRNTRMNCGRLKKKRMETTLGDREATKVAVVQDLNLRSRALKCFENHAGKPVRGAVARGRGQR